MQDLKHETFDDRVSLLESQIITNLNARSETHSKISSASSMESDYHKS